MQGVLAPFVLENLNCTGAEAMLVDCPVATDFTDYNDVPVNSAGQYEFTYLNNFDSISCDFFEARFPFVACGGVTGPGAHRSKYYAVHSMIDLY